MTGTYPIIVNGKQAGELTVSKEGMLTRFDAVCADLGGKVLRLSLYGEGREGYLGVMLPGNGLLRLTKSLSKLGLAGFPENPTHAAEAGQGAAAMPMLAEQPVGRGAPDAPLEPPEPPPSPPDPPPEPPDPPPEPEIAPSPPPRRPELPPGTEYIDFSRFETAVISGPEPEAMPDPEPMPAPEPVPEPELIPEPESLPEPEPEQDTFLWKREPGGALSCVHGELRLLALPVNTPRLPMEKAWDTRAIEGRRYAIFKIDNGKMI